MLCHNNGHRYLLQPDNSRPSPFTAHLEVLQQRRGTGLHPLAPVAFHLIAASCYIDFVRLPVRGRKARGKKQALPLQ